MREYDASINDTATQVKISDFGPKTYDGSDRADKDKYTYVGNSINNASEIDLENCSGTIYRYFVPYYPVICEDWVGNEGPLAGTLLGYAVGDNASPRTSGLARDSIRWKPYGIKVISSEYGEIETEGYYYTIFVYLTNDKFNSTEREKTVDIATEDKPNVVKRFFRRKNWTFPTYEIYTGKGGSGIALKILKADGSLENLMSVSGGNGGLAKNYLASHQCEELAYMDNNNQGSIYNGYPSTNENLYSNPSIGGFAYTDEANKDKGYEIRSVNSGKQRYDRDINSIFSSATLIEGYTDTSKTAMSKQNQTVTSTSCNIEPIPAVRFNVSNNGAGNMEDFVFYTADKITIKNEFTCDGGAFMYFTTDPEDKDEGQRITDGTVLTKADVIDKTVAQRGLSSYTGGILDLYAVFDKDVAGTVWYANRN